MKNILTRPRARSETAASPDHRLLGDHHRDARRWEDAASAYCQHLEAAPDDTAIWIQAGNCFKEAGNFVRSLAAYRRAERLEPDNFEVHLQLGHLYKVGGQYAAALAAYERAAALRPDFDDIRHEIRGVSERLKAEPAGAATAVGLFASVDELLAALRELPPDEDPFAAYFRSIGGYAIGRRT